MEGLYQGRMNRERGVGIMWVQERWWEDGLMIRARWRRESITACVCHTHTHTFTPMNINVLN